MEDPAASANSIDGRSSLQAHAESTFPHAIDIARSQKALLIELRTSRDLAQFLGDGDRKGEALALLAPVYATFAEGFGFPDLVEVRMLLDELGASLASNEGCAAGSAACGSPTEPVSRRQNLRLSQIRQTARAKGDHHPTRPATTLSARQCLDRCSLSSRLSPHDATRSRRSPGGNIPTAADQARRFRCWARWVRAQELRRSHGTCRCSPGNSCR